MKSDKLAKTVERVVRKKIGKTVITKIRNESGDVTTDLTEIKKNSFIREYYEQWYGKKLDNQMKMNKILKTHKLPVLTQEEREYRNRLVTSKKINDEKPLNKEKARTRSLHQRIPPVILKCMPIFLNSSKRQKRR